MTELSKKIYWFLFQKHCVGFIRFCYAMLIPCALSQEFCRWWMLFASFTLALATQANAKGWNRIVSPSRTEEEIRASLSPEARELFDKVLDDIRMNEED